MLSTTTRRPRHRLLIAIAAVAALSAPSVPASIPEEPERWAAHYDDGRSFPDYGESVALSPDGSRMFVTGARVLGYDFFGRPIMGTMTVAYETATGEREWVLPAGGPLAVSPDGTHVYLALGSSIYAYAAATGVERWHATYQDPADEHGGLLPRAIAVSPDGSLVHVTGTAFEHDHWDYATVAYSVSGRDQAWVSFYDSQTYLFDEAVAIGVSPDGARVFVTGLGADAYGVGFRNFVDIDTVAYDARTGIELWVAHHDGGSHDYASDMAVSLDGSHVYVVGWSRIGLGDDDSYAMATVAYDAASGAEAWSARHTEQTDVRVFPARIAVSPDDETVYSAGVVGSYFDSAADYGVVAYRTTKPGTQWSFRLDAGDGDADVPAGLAVSPDADSVYVTGRSFGTVVAPATTVSIAAGDGSTRWVARYAGPQSRGGFLTDVALSPGGGSIYVVGSVYVYPADYDMLTIAYRSTTCAVGRSENGPASGVVQQHVEPRAGPAAPWVHGTNCDLVAPVERQPPGPTGQ